MPRYNPAQIEPKWQQYWEENQTFRAPDLPGDKKLYALDMFPYPSGDGLHVGHPEGYTATDIVSRYRRMCGYDVLHPMGFDAFGLPAEEHAIKTNTPPRIQTEKNIATFRRQLKMLGFSYDWQRELATTDVDYFRWTQWIFLVLFDTWFDGEQQQGRPISELPIPDEIAAEGDAAIEQYRDDHRLAYQCDALVNWCPALGTVLANEEVIDGRSERGDHPVKRIPLRQWMLRITDYADRLERGLDDLDWSDSIKSLQRNWIGRSTGAEVDFYSGSPDGFETWKANRAQQGWTKQPGDEVLRVYTTRPDTLFGATYMVIAPEHAAVQQLTTEAQTAEVQAYCESAASKSDLERTELTKTKTGVFTGSYAINPVNGQPVPIWVADYVLISYGTGAIMAVPNHDTRDFEFAAQFEIPIVPVVDPGESQADVDRQTVLAGKSVFTGEGHAVNSGTYDGTPTAEFKQRITDDLAKLGLGRGAVNYKLRDWLFSRQRFWGEPFPILHELDDQGQPTGRMRVVDADQLPVDLPHLDDYKPHGRPEPPLAKAPDSWLYVTIDGKRYRRETNTMPQWAGSCWYYLRFIDPKNDQQFVDRDKQARWLPVDLYVGGAEHAVLHLLYARFWHNVLFDRGYVTTREPFQRLVNQGMILGEMEYSAYQTKDGQWVSAANVKDDAEGNSVRADGEPLTTVRVEAADVTKHGESFVLTADASIRVDSRAYKMSKSRGNVVNPDVIVREYGADSLRLYEMFMGPLEATKPWSMKGVDGVRKFLDRVWRLVVDDRAEQPTLNTSIVDEDATDAQQRVLHKTIEAVTNDLDTMSFNTAIARMMEFVNYFTKQSKRPRSTMRDFVLLLSPMAPHLAEELWQLLGGEKTLAYESWPQYDKAFTVDDTIEIPVQVCGKVKAKLNVPADASQAQLEQLALADDKVQSLLAGKQLIKTIVVPGRMVNFVAK